MQVSRIGLVILSVLSLSGCGGGFMLDAPIKLTATVPDVGAVSIREVGDPLFYNEVIANYDAVTFVSNQKIKLLGVDYEFREAFLKGKFGKKSQYYCGPLYRVGVLDNVRACYTPEMLNKENIPFKTTRVTLAEPTNFRQELVYQGRVGNELRISYREFSGEMARPAFTQELTFEVNGGVIGAKGARLEVLEATNTNIRYRVLQGFN